MNIILGRRKTLRKYAVAFLLYVELSIMFEMQINMVYYDGLSIFR